MKKKLMYLLSVSLFLFSIVSPVISYAESTENNARFQTWVTEHEDSLPGSEVAILSVKNNYSEPASNVTFQSELPEIFHEENGEKVSFSINQLQPGEQKDFVISKAAVTSDEDTQGLEENQNNTSSTESESTSESKASIIGVDNGGSSVSGNSTRPSSSTTTQGKNLPATNDQNNLYLVIVGILVLLSVLVLWRKGKINKNVFLLFIFVGGLVASQVTVHAEDTTSYRHKDDNFNHLVTLSDEEYVFHLSAEGDFLKEETPKPNTWTVDFKTNGGPEIAAITGITDGGNIVQPDVGSYDGYEFLGWYVDEGLTEVFDFGTPITSNLTLYAKWEKLNVLEFSSGIIRSDYLTQDVPESTKMKTGTLYTIPEVFPQTSKEDFMMYSKFRGWKVQNDSTETIYDHGDQLLIEEDTTLVAQWDYYPFVTYFADELYMIYEGQPATNITTDESLSPEYTSESTSHHRLIWRVEDFRIGKEVTLEDHVYIDRYGQEFKKVYMRGMDTGITGSVSAYSGTMVDNLAVIPSGNDANSDNRYFTNYSLSNFKPLIDTWYQQTIAGTERELSVLSCEIPDGANTKVALTSSGIRQAFLPSHGDLGIVGASPYGTHSKEFGTPSHPLSSIAPLQDLENLSLQSDSWLRSSYQGYNSQMRYTKNNYYGWGAGYNAYGIRPAMWVTF